MFLVFDKNDIYFFLFGPSYNKYFVFYSCVRIVTVKNLKDILIIKKYYYSFQNLNHFLSFLKLQKSIKDIKKCNWHFISNKTYLLQFSSSNNPKSKRDKMGGKVKE